MMTFLQAAEAVATSEETRMGLWTLFTKGGWLMWPLNMYDCIGSSGSLCRFAVLIASS